MKSLGQTITESFNNQEEILESLILESFESPILRQIFGSNEKMFAKALKDSVYNCKWSDVTDEMITKFDDLKKAKWIANNEEANDSIIFWMNGETLNGMSTSNWVRTTETYRSGRRGMHRPVYSSITAISKASTHAFVIRGIKGLRIGANDLRNGRWASKIDVAAWESNYKIANDNRERYKAILAERKLELKLDENSTLTQAFEKAMHDYALMMDKLVGTSDWASVKRLGSLVKEFLDEWSNFLHYGKYNENSKSGSFDKIYNARNLTASIDTMNVLIAKANEFNKEVNAEDVE